MGSCSIPGNAVIPTTQAGGISALEFFSWFLHGYGGPAMADHKDVELVLLDFGKDLSRGRRAAYHKASLLSTLCRSASMRGSGLSESTRMGSCGMAATCPRAEFVLSTFYR
jgi:hypothetical protein